MISSAVTRWVGLLSLLPLAASAAAPDRYPSKYNNWSTTALTNGLIELQVLPQIGGRIIQYRLGKREFLWANPQLAGRLPEPNGLAADGTWFNAGGDKLWPAPQGWDNDTQWPGPPDGVLDGQPYLLENLRPDREQIGVRLTSRKDTRSGIRFSRIVRIYRDTTRVSFEATMENIDTKPRRWGIWAHTQLDASAAPGSTDYNAGMSAWCPVNPRSQFQDGYSLIFGEKDNPSFKVDPRGLMQVNYQYRVGKIGMDSRAGWIATITGDSGDVFVQKFKYANGQQYPDASSVEFWHNGKGKIRAYNKEMVMGETPAENPYVFESELLSPYAALKPNQKYSWGYDWYACNVGGNRPILDANDFGVTVESLNAPVKSGKARITGCFGVFATGKLEIEFIGRDDRVIGRHDLEKEVGPLKPAVLDTTVAVPERTSGVRLVLKGSGTVKGELAKCLLTVAEPEGVWPAEKAMAWYNAQPWLLGCNFLPSTAVNDVEMWQPDTFDRKTIDRELGWAQDLGFNTVRVFLNYAVWEDDAGALKNNLDWFLSRCAKRNLKPLIILFDDCFKPEPKVGKQQEPEPGVHNSQWVQSPGAHRRDNPQAWPRLEAYVKDIIGQFAEDKRVLAWEIYNEPSVSLPFVEAAFRWAREAGPSQPVTTTIFGPAEMQKRIIELSDILCFHHYGNLPGTRAEAARLQELGRPVLCTEYMARTVGSRFETHLPFFKEQRIGCWNWGFVAGRTQTYFPWGSPKGAPEPRPWFHDVLRADGTPFDAREVRAIQIATGKLRAQTVRQPVILLPSARATPLPWRYTLEQPANDWFQPDFDDKSWQEGSAPFGQKESGIGRLPNTVWTSNDIWMRCETKIPAWKKGVPRLFLQHDEDTEVYINGVLAVKVAGYNADYESFELSKESLNALRPGKNRIAVHCHQTTGGQYIDLGITAGE